MRAFSRNKNIVKDTLSTIYEGTPWGHKEWEGADIPGRDRLEDAYQALLIIYGGKKSRADVGEFLRKRGYGL